MDQQDYRLGLEIVNSGLQHLPRSSRLYYERGTLYSYLDQPDPARNSWAEVSKLAPGSEVSFLALSQRSMLDGNMPEAIEAAREGVQQYPRNYFLLTLLGEALIRSGAAPGQPEFAEALLNLGHALMALGKEEEARSCWRRAIREKPELAQSYFEPPSAGLASSHPL
jgi:tetratricopeptide (TPR) repeat protein